MDRATAIRNTLGGSQDNAIVSSLSNLSTPPTLQAVEYQVDRKSLDLNGIVRVLSDLSQHLDQGNQGPLSDTGAGDLGEVQAQRLAAMTACHLYDRALELLLYNDTLPRFRDVDYWDSVLYAGPIFGLTLYTVQNAPRWAWSRAAIGLPTPSSALFTSLYASATTQLAGKHRWWAHPWTVLSAPLNVVQRHIKRNRSGAEKLKRQAAERLGLVLKGLPKDGELNPDQLPAQVLKSIVETLEPFLEPGTNDTPASVGDGGAGAQTLTVQYINRLTRIAKVFQSSRFNSKSSNAYSPPGFLWRYWPVVAAGLLGGYKVLGNWRAIVSWTNDHIVDTTISLWKNWIVEPLYKVYQTIRHDENAQMSIMGRKSLKSDMESLERMVVTYAGENADTEAAAEIRSAVSQGDLSVVLEKYEKQIETPIKSLLKGELIRTLLIQVQKTKVDVEVAMDGYDRVLKSQQLVVVLVAALPALGVLWWGWQFLGSGRRDAQKLRSVSRTKDEIKVRLGKLSTIVNQPTSELEPVQIGLLLCQTVQLEQLGVYLFSSPRQKQWASRLRRVENAQSSEQLDIEIRDVWVQFGADLR